MGLLISAARAASTGSSNLATPEQWIIDWFRGGSKTASGVNVNAGNALKWGPFFAGIRNLSEDIGSLPLPTYERKDDGTKARAVDHPVYPVLHDQANPLMGAMQLRSTMQGHAVSWGFGAANIETDGRGRIQALWPLRPDRLTPDVSYTSAGRARRRFLYDDPVNNIKAVLLEDEVLYLPGFGFDGVRGYSVLTLMREAIGLGLATEQYGASYFGNGSKPSGVLNHPGNVSDPARARIKADWESLHRGLDRAQRIAILEEGVTFDAIGIPPGDSQFIETRKFQRNEAAMWLRLPPHKLGDLEKASYSNIEQQSLEYVIDSLRPWLVRWEQALLMSIFTPSERRRYFSEHIVEGLLRGDIKTRYDAYAIGRQWGFESTNSILAKENRNGIGPAGDIHLVPLNMVPLDQLAGDPDSDAPRIARLDLRGSEGRARIGDAFEPMVEDIDLRIAKLERAEVRKLVDRHLDDRGVRSTSAFLADVEDLYEDLIRDKAIERWLPTFTTFANEVARSAADDVGYDGEIDLGRWVEAYVEGHVGYRVGSSLGQISSDLDTDDPAEAIRDRLDRWVAQRPARTATWEKVSLTAAAAREAWKEAGVKRMQWVTVGKNCPYCDGLNGRTVGILEPFVSGGTALSAGDDSGEELHVPRNTFHPPIHPDCDCRLVSA